MSPGGVWHWAWPHCNSQGHYNFERWNIINLLVEICFDDKILY